MNIRSPRIWNWIAGIGFVIIFCCGPFTSPVALGAEGAAPSMAGTWTKSADYAIILSDDGVWTGMRRASKGSWRWVDKAARQLEITLKDGKDTVVLAADGSRASGTDDKGAPVEYVKGDQRKALAAAKEAKPGSAPPLAPTPRPPVKESPAAPTVVSDREKGAALLKGATSSLVFIEGKDGAGSGFISELGGVKQLFTNLHVLAHTEGAKFTLLDRSALQLGASAAAVDHDVGRIAVVSAAKPLACMQDVERNVTIGEDVVVLGNAEGQRVINPIYGKLIGIGPNLVEVDAAFVPGNSGSPIIHLRTGQVIGIATYAVVRQFSPIPGAPNVPKVRRFGYRLDSIQKWQPLQPAEFFAEGAQKIRIEQLTEDLIALCRDFGENRKITAGRHQNPLLQQPIADFLKVMRTPSRSENLAATARKEFLWSLHNISQSDVTNAKARTQYDYFQRALAEETSEREQIYKALESVVLAR